MTDLRHRVAAILHRFEGYTRPFDKVPTKVQQHYLRMADEAIAEVERTKGQSSERT